MIRNKKNLYCVIGYIWSIYSHGYPGWTWYLRIKRRDVMAIMDPKDKYYNKFINCLNGFNYIKNAKKITNNFLVKIFEKYFFDYSFIFKTDLFYEGVSIYKLLKNQKNVKKIYILEKNGEKAPLDENEKGLFRAFISVFKMINDLII